MKIYQKLGTVLALTLGGVTAANATVLYDNLPTNVQAIDSGLGLAGNGFIANQFSTGSLCPSGCTLGGITLNLTSQDGTTAGYLLQILSDAAGSPGSVLGSLNNPSSFSTDFNNNTFTPTGTISLGANKNYWVELSSTNVNGALTYWDYNFNATQAVPNQPNLAAYQVGFEQAATTSVNFLMKVEATPTHAPIPGAAWMMSSALLGLVTSWRKKSQSR
jgi:hypothetical protein